MFENFTHEDAFRFVKRAFKLAFGFAPRSPEVYFTYIYSGSDGSSLCFEFTIGVRSYRLVVTDATTSYSHDRNYHLNILDAYGRGHDDYMCLSEPYKTRI